LYLLIFIVGRHRCCRRRCVLRARQHVSFVWFWQALVLKLLGQRQPKTCDVLFIIVYSVDRLA